MFFFAFYLEHAFYSHLALLYFGAVFVSDICISAITRIQILFPVSPLNEIYLQTTVGGHVFMAQSEREREIHQPKRQGRASALGSYYCHPKIHFKQAKDEQKKRTEKTRKQRENKKRKKSLRKKLNCICVFLSHVTTLLLLYFYYHSLLDVSIGCIHYVCASASLLCECGCACGCVCALVKLYICTLKGELCSRAFCAFLAAEN